MDFSAMLTIATAVTGVIWAIDVLFFKKKRLERNNETEDTHEPKIAEYARSFFPILLIVLILRSFIAEPAHAMVYDEGASAVSPMRMIEPALAYGAFPFGIAAILGMAGGVLGALVILKRKQ